MTLPELAANLDAIKKPFAADVGYKVGYLSDTEPQIGRDLQAELLRISVSLGAWLRGYENYLSTEDEALGKTLYDSGNLLYTQLLDFEAKVDDLAPSEALTMLRGIGNVIIETGVEAAQIVAEPLQDIGNIGIFAIRNLVPIAIIGGLAYLIIPRILASRK